jgi:hypothetical protein
LIGHDDYDDDVDIDEDGGDDGDNNANKIMETIPNCQLGYPKLKFIQ